MQETQLVFTPSDTLVAYLEQLYSGLLVAPNIVHTEAMKGIVEHFIDEVIQAFFNGLIEAIKAEGAVVNIILKGVAVISKTSRSLALRLLERVTVADQANLVAHFQRLHFEKDGQQYVGFPLRSEAAAKVEEIFAGITSGADRQSDSLVIAMQEIAKGALYHYMDATVEAIEVGAFSRGLVKAARVTINRSISTAINKGVPAMGVSYRLGLVAYFEAMLLKDK